jgi:indolepyruvate ferredoxin oxidoreductase alpha subunit
MTGGQPNPGILTDIGGGEGMVVSIEELSKAAGAGYVKTIDPGDLDNSVKTFKEGLQYEGVSVIISRSPCVVFVKPEKERLTYQINQEKCTRCLICLRQFNCPALYQREDGSIDINYLLCTDCGYCVQVCPQKAIEVKK